MAVRVRVRIKVGKKTAETSAVLNSGYEAEGPEIVLPSKLAEVLGLLPHPPRQARIETFLSPAGPTRMVCVPAVARVSLAGIAQGRIVLCSAAISDVEHEVILNDQAVDGLAVEIVAPGRGIWRRAREKTARKSVTADYW